MYIINQNAELYVPYFKVNVNFSQKERSSLNCYQKLLLEAVEKALTIEQIVDALQLTKNSIEMKLMELEMQKLICFQNGKYQLTELSKKILLIDRIIPALNKENINICVNLFTGSIERFQDDEFVEPSNVGFSLHRKIRSLDGISIEKNMDFFAENMENLRNREQEEVDEILSELVVEFSAIKIGNQDNWYKKINITHLPCWISDQKVDDSLSDDVVIMEGKCKKLTFRFACKKVEQYSLVLKSLKNIEKSAPELLSDMAKEVLRKEQECASYQKQSICVWYDGVSGMYVVDTQVLPSLKNKAQLEIGEVHPLSDIMKNQIVEEIRNRLQITDEDILVTIENEENNVYRLKCDMNHLY